MSKPVKKGRNEATPPCHYLLTFSSSRTSPRSGGEE